MMLHRVNEVICHGSGLLDGVHPRLQVGDQDFPLFIGGTVQVVGAVLDFCDAEGHAGQGGAVRAQFDQMEGGFEGVGKDKLRRLVGVQLNDALGLVDDIAGTLQLCHHISPRLQLGQVNFTVLVGGELRRAKAAVHGLNAELSVRDHLGRIGAVHLDQIDAGLAVIKEVKGLDAIPGGELDLLGRGIHQVAAVPGVYLLDQIGARRTVGQGDLA